MQLPQHKNASVDLHNFSMIPKADIPRAQFNRQSTHKTTFDAGYLIPVYIDEVLPGDAFNVSATIFARLTTPINPIMDNLHLDTHFFFVPIRLIWNNWQKMQGEQENPGDSISYITPVCNTPAGGYDVGSLQDYFGLPTVGDTFGGAAVASYSQFWARAYNLIWNEWFRDENLQDSVVVDKDDGPDDPADYVLLRRGKRHDYFTASLPWPQKGATAVSLPLGTSAPIQYINQNTTGWVARRASDGALAGGGLTGVSYDANSTLVNEGNTIQLQLDPQNNLYADLSQATAATINQLRLAFQTQKLLERDARGGTRYTEIIRSHFGVISPDARLQRPEYLGGGSTPVVINPTVQTSGTSASGTTTPLGTLAAVGAAVARGHGFNQSFTEHGVIIGLMSVRADLTYQQGVRRMFNRSTRYDYYLPAFAMLGEQAVLNKEIYATGNSTVDNGTWGYIPRWDEYRYRPSMITGLFRSTANGTIDNWHLAQNFANLPVLNDEFIQDQPPVERILAVGAAANGKQFYCDCFFTERLARPLPMHSVPGLIDHF